MKIINRADASWKSLRLTCLPVVLGNEKVGAEVPNANIVDDVATIFLFLLSRYCNVVGNFVLAKNL